MKYLESEYYSGGWYFGNQSYATIRNWFKIKDKAFRGIKHVKKRHRRSMRYNDMSRLVHNRIYVFTRESKTIGRRKHGKWLYMPKRIVLLGRRKVQNEA